MLLNRRPDLTPVHEVLPQSETVGTLIHSYFLFLRRQFLPILCCLLLGASFGAIYLLATPPTYTASATMILDSRRGGIQQKSVLGDTPAFDNTWIDSQLGILALKRDKIGTLVAEKLHLAKTFVEPEEGSGSPLAAFFSKPFQGRTDSQSKRPNSELELTQQVASEIANGLDVKRVGMSYLVSINFSSHKQEQVAGIVNAAADAYVVTEMDDRYKAIRQASDWLQERYQTLREQASAADRAVVEFKNHNNIVTAGGRTINDQQLAELNTRLGGARAHTADTQAKLSQIEAVLRVQQSNGTVDQTVTDAISNPIITKLQSQYLDLVNREADWTTRLGRNHLAVVNIHNQAQEIRNSIHSELQRIAETYKSDNEVAKKNQDELEKQLADTIAELPNDAQITLRGLEGSAQSYHAFYDNFFLNYTESVQQQSSPIPETQVISYAPGAYKSSPSTPRTITMSVLGGLVLGIGLGMLRELMDGAFRTSGQVEAALQMECLALIPKVQNEPQSESSSRQQLKLIVDSKNQRIIGPASDALRLLIEAPFSR
ncbi:MAG TPA: GumC family protein, partial [Candidatus Acidoferrum sp.]|nr:GumC family protein [Candidatus Acidoferrum sp.]